MEKQRRLKMEKTMMTKLKLLTAAAALLVPLASAPVFAQVRPLHLDRTQTQTNDNSGWNGYNNGGYNNTWYDGKKYRSGPMPLGEDIASDATSFTR
jgi:opacity protein-like surface antigen